MQSSKIKTPGFWKTSTHDSFLDWTSLNNFQAKPFPENYLANRRFAGEIRFTHKNACFFVFIPLSIDTKKQADNLKSQDDQSKRIRFIKDMDG
jgi:hypothetical protein